MDVSLEDKAWWGYIHEDLRELVRQSFLLLDIASKWEEKLPEGRHNFHDYSFIVFPVAKAYEGFLKTLFLDLGFISEEDFYGKRFRVGKSLNPALEKRLRQKVGVYDKLVNFCKGKGLADKLWDTWRSCRNLLFHWFPREKNAITLEEARARVLEVLDAMDMAFRECKLEHSGVLSYNQN